jgi:RNA recognition motif-containing protein
MTETEKKATDKAVTERRVVYVGGVPFNCTPSDLRSWFECYGEIETTSVHFREKRCAKFT